MGAITTQINENEKHCTTYNRENNNENVIVDTQNTVKAEMEAQGTTRIVLTTLKRLKAQE